MSCHKFISNATLVKFDIYTWKESYFNNNLIKGKDTQLTCIKLYSAINFNPVKFLTNFYGQFKMKTTDCKQNKMQCA